ncbi:MAG: siderophore-interacting protein [Bacteroidota bacterium]
MPTVPKWMANGMEKIFSGLMSDVLVTQTDYPAPRLKRIRFVGDLGDRPFHPGQVIEFRVGDRDFRHYTPAHYDATAGICEVLFYLHGRGPGSAWAEALRVGDRVKLMGPGGKMKYRDELAQHFVFGDETTLGLLQLFQSHAQQCGQHLEGLLELNARYQAWPVELGLGAMVVGKSTVPAAREAVDQIQKWLNAEPHRKSETAFYLCGRAQSIQQIQRVLRFCGIDRRRITSHPYWADGKKGL